MKTFFLWLSIVAVGSLTLVGCPPTMEVMNNVLLLKNDSDTKIKTLLNFQYPDSTLANAFPDRYLSPRSEAYIGNFYMMGELSGLTLLVVEYAYYKSRWHEGVGTPETYLAEDKILKLWVLSRHELDSLGWVLRYP